MIPGTWTGRTHGINAVHRQLLHDAGDAGDVLRSEETMAAPVLSLVYPSAKLARDLRIFINGIESAAQTAVAR